MHTKFPSTKYIKEDFDDFVPNDFKDRMLARDSSFESEEENPLGKLEEEEAKEFYNMVRSIFSSANISLKNEQLYSPLLEALIKNYSKRLKLREKQGKVTSRESGRTVTSRINTLREPKPVPKHKHFQAQLLDLKTSSGLTDGWVLPRSPTKTVKFTFHVYRISNLQMSKN